MSTEYGCVHMENLHKRDLYSQLASDMVIKLAE